MCVQTAVEAEHAYVAKKAKSSIVLSGISTIY